MKVVRISHETDRRHGGVIALLLKPESGDDSPARSEAFDDALLAKARAAVEPLLKKRHRLRNEMASATGSAEASERTAARVREDIGIASAALFGGALTERLRALHTQLDDAESRAREWQGKAADLRFELAAADERLRDAVAAAIGQAAAAAMESARETVKATGQAVADRVGGLVDAHLAAKETLRDLAEPRYRSMAVRRLLGTLGLPVSEPKLRFEDRIPT